MTEAAKVEERSAPEASHRRLISDAMREARRKARAEYLRDKPELADMLPEDWFPIHRVRLEAVGMKGTGGDLQVTMVVNEGLPTETIFRSKPEHMDYLLRAPLGALYREVHNVLDAYERGINPDHCQLCHGHGDVQHRDRVREFCAEFEARERGLN